VSRNFFGAQVRCGLKQDAAPSPPTPPTPPPGGGNISQWPRHRQQPTCSSHPPTPCPALPPHRWTPSRSAYLRPSASSSTAARTTSEPSSSARLRCWRWGAGAPARPCRSLVRAAARAPARRAPIRSRRPQVGPGVEALASYTLTAEEAQAQGRDSVVVAVRSGHLVATAFHPEITSDARWAAGSRPRQPPSPSPACPLALVAGVQGAASGPGRRPVLSPATAAATPPALAGASSREPGAWVPPSHHGDSAPAWSGPQVAPHVRADGG
jgi:hypothetical protein